MPIRRLPVFATGFGGCMLAMAGLLLCIVLWVAGHHPAMHVLLPYILPDFPQITVGGVARSLLASLLIGYFGGIVFAVSFNLWNVIAARISGRAA